MWRVGLLQKPWKPYVVDPMLCSVCTLLGGSWVVFSGVISPLIWDIIIVTILITPLIATHEPPSRHDSWLTLGFNGG